MQIFHLYAELLFNFHLWGYNVICPEISRALQKSGQKAIFYWVVTSCLCFLWLEGGGLAAQASSRPGTPSLHARLTRWSPIFPVPLKIREHNYLWRCTLWAVIEWSTKGVNCILPQRGSSQGDPSIDLGAGTGSLQWIKMQRSHPSTHGRA